MILIEKVCTQNFELGDVLVYFENPHTVLTVVLNSMIDQAGLLT